ncbi:GNAT family N-acetyltransferase [Lysinibacillus xylanilyticus]|uniref:GNAT family N-acetyltransferase n=1 Tax=Lysinibacillus xylanilyticus TaxID=582475 RepID=UPI0037FA275E
MEFRLFTNEIENLKTLMTNNTWDYHLNKIVEEETIQQKYDNGYYQDDRETYWIIDDNKMKVGIVLIEDINDSILSLDIRIDKQYRGNGYGVNTLLWLQDYLFGEKGKIRIEGYTRVDNIGMRKCFSKAGFVKEAYLRDAWENIDGSATDSILYSSIKSDWKNGKITPIRLNDIPY